MWRFSALLPAKCRCSQVHVEAFELEDDDLRIGRVGRCRAGCAAAICE